MDEFITTQDHSLPEGENEELAVVCLSGQANKSDHTRLGLSVEQIASSHLSTQPH